MKKKLTGQWNGNLVIFPTSLYNIAWLHNVYVYKKTHFFSPSLTPLDMRGRRKLPGMFCIDGHLLVLICSISHHHIVTLISN
jgi:hypothetical protein